MNLEQFAGVNAAYVLELYERYRQNPESVDPETRKAFENWTPEAERSPADVGRRAGVETRVIVGAANLVESIRRYGHLAAQLDPLGSAPVGDPSLSPRAHGITDDDLKRLPASLVGGPVAESSANAFEAIEKLRRVYCSTTGFDFAQVFVPEEREWLRHAAESGRFLPPMDARSADGAARPRHAGRGLRALSASYLPGQDALLRSKGSTCSCRSSTRSSAAPPTAARARR